MRLYKIFILSIGIIIFFSCEFSKSGTDNAEVIAEAYGQVLYRYELEDYLDKLGTRPDSNILISQFIDQWVMDEILLHEAQLRIKNTASVEELVRDYEQSLMIKELERLFLDQYLDTLVSSSEIDSFYKFHSEDFLLTEDIIRMFFIKIPKEAANDSLATMWETEDLPVLRQYVESHDGLQLLDDRTWYSPSMLKNILPPDLFDKLAFKKTDSFALEDEDNKFYIKILEIIRDKDTPPISYVKEKIRIRIIQNRIKNLLKRKKAQLYNEKIKSKQIRIYGKEGQ